MPSTDHETASSRTTPSITERLQRRASSTRSPPRLAHIMGSLLTPRCSRCSRRSRRSSPCTTPGTRGVPSQTFCNRSFFHASTSHGFVTNKHGGGYAQVARRAGRADDLQPPRRWWHLSWRIYFDELQLVSFTGVLHAPVLETYWRTDHFATMKQTSTPTSANGALPGVRVHRAAHDLQPQRLPSAVQQSARERRRREPKSSTARSPTSGPARR